MLISEVSILSAAFACHAGNGSADYAPCSPSLWWTAFSSTITARTSSSGHRSGPSEWQQGLPGLPAARSPWGSGRDLPARPAPPSHREQRRHCRRRKPRHDGRPRRSERPGSSLPPDPVNAALRFPPRAQPGELVTLVDIDHLVEGNFEADANWVFARAHDLHDHMIETFRGHVVRTRSRSGNDDRSPPGPTVPGRRRGRPSSAPANSVPRGTRGWYGDASGAVLIETLDGWNAHLAYLVFPGITSSSRIDRRDTGRGRLRSRGWITSGGARRCGRHGLGEGAFQPGQYLVHTERRGRSVSVVAVSSSPMSQPETTPYFQIG